MTTTATIAGNLKTRVSGTFAATGFVAGATPEQIAAGRSLPPGLMPPCVLILAGDGAVEDSTLTRRQRFRPLGGPNLNMRSHRRFNLYQCTRNTLLNITRRA